MGATTPPAFAPFEDGVPRHHPRSHDDPDTAVAVPVGKLDVPPWGLLHAAHPRGRTSTRRLRFIQVLEARDGIGVDEAELEVPSE